MRNIKLTIEYDGTRYNGWQRQRSLKCKVESVKLKRKVKNPTLRTIQEEIEKAIEIITGKRSTLYGSGRTDSGVHAKAQVANFHTDCTLPTDKLQKALNAVLPKDISVIKTEKTHRAFHSRYSAKSKTYCYAILNRRVRSPFLSRYSLHIPHKLNFSLMRKEASVLLGRHNFKSFQAASRKGRPSVRKIKKIILSKDKNSVIKIIIEADGFLYNMARNIAGTLIETGKGKLPPGSMKKILNAKDRNMAGETAPARGLCLIEVKY